MELSQRIQRLCAERGISISKLENDLGLSNGSIKKGSNIRSDRLVAIADYFDVTTDFLLGRNVDFMVGDDLLIEVMTLNKSDKNRLREYVELLKKAGENK